jgi:hypothetical protein
MLVFNESDHETTGATDVGKFIFSQILVYFM